MAITGQGITYYPLFWVFNDQWKYYRPRLSEGVDVYNHWGHLHFFMLGLNPTSQSDDAFAGQQRYSFALKDIWGPRSQDPNQDQLYRVIGTPKWYYHVTELWRRVFVQPWDAGNGRGVKYDAAPADKRMGPFREGLSNHGLTSYAPYWMANARSAPIDYFTSSEHRQDARLNAVAERARSLLGADYDDRKYNLQHSNYVLAANQVAPSDVTTTHAGVPPFSDALYIWPVIEYQQVLQLNWEPLPGSAPDVDDPNLADTAYGDGWNTQVTVPFVDPVSGIYRSPFAETPGVCLPFGSYNELSFPSRQLVPAANRLRHGPASYDTSRPYDDRLDLPVEQAGTPITEWHNPWGDASGGRVVQQCLGGVVHAVAKIIVEHKLGGRQVLWVRDLQYLPTSDFEGSDQKLPL